MLGLPEFAKETLLSLRPKSKRRHAISTEAEDKPNVHRSENNFSPLTVNKTLFSPSAAPLPPPPSAPYVTISHPEQSISLLPSLSPSPPSLPRNPPTERLSRQARNTPTHRGGGERKIGEQVFNRRAKEAAFVGSLIIQNASSIVGLTRRTEFGI